MFYTSPFRPVVRTINTKFWLFDSLLCTDFPQFFFIFLSKTCAKQIFSLNISTFLRNKMFTDQCIVYIVTYICVRYCAQNRHRAVCNPYIQSHRFSSHQYCQVKMENSCAYTHYSKRIPAPTTCDTKTLLSGGHWYVCWLFFYSFSHTSKYLCIDQQYIPHSKLHIYRYTYCIYLFRRLYMGKRKIFTSVYRKPFAKMHQHRHRRRK